MKTKFFKKLIGISVSVTLFLLIISFFVNGFSLKVFTQFKSIGIGFTYAFVLSLLNYGLFSYLNKRYDWKKDTKKLVFIGVIGSIILTVLGYGITKFILFVLLFQEVSVAQFFVNQWAVDYVVVFLITLLIASIMYAYYFYQALQRRKIEEQKRIAENANARFEALKNQLDPHFLFNSLNVLDALIEENPKKAQGFTRNLSKIYRYVLEQKENRKVTLQKELNFAKSYIDLLKERFGDSIQVNLPEDRRNSQSKIVPLSLQLALENAVKHNAISETKPLHIRVFEKDGFLNIENNLQIKPQLKKSTGVGIENIKERYALLTDKAVKVIQTKEQFKLLLPLL